MKGVDKHNVHEHVETRHCLVSTTPTSNTPALRFPGFEGEWELKKLGELLEFKNGINASKEQYGQGCKFINVLDILNNDFITHDKIIGSVDVDKETANKNIVSYGDILFQRSSETREEVGTANVYLDKEKTATFGGFVIRGRKIGEYDPIFLNKILKTDSARDEITSKSGGSTRYNVGQEILASVQLYFPTLPEQNKIATFLSAVDEKLQQLKQEKAHLTQYKKGVMQQIFNQEIRFKDDDGSEFPDWEEKSLGDIAEINPSIKGLPESFIYIDLESVVSGRLIKENTITKYESPSRAQRVLRKNDILFQMVRPYQKNNLYFDRIGDYVASTGYAQIRTNQNSMYIYQYLHLQIFVDDVIERCTGTSYPAINSTDLSKIIILIPILSEQIKIANFLSAIDENINNITNQITLTEQWKKGLLQGMFV